MIPDAIDVGKAFINLLQTGLYTYTRPLDKADERIRKNETKVKKTILRNELIPYLIPFPNPPFPKKEPDKEPYNNSDSDPHRDSELPPDAKQRKDVIGESLEHLPPSSKKKDTPLDH